MAIPFRSRPESVRLDFGSNESANTGRFEPATSPRGVLSPLSRAPIRLPTKAATQKTLRDDGEDAFPSRALGDDAFDDITLPEVPRALVRAAARLARERRRLFD